MYIDIDWDKVIGVQYHIEGDGIWSISIGFDNGEACTYGYTDLKSYMKDCSAIADRRLNG